MSISPHPPTPTHPPPPPIPEIQHFQNLTLKIKGQGHWWGHSLSHNEGLTSYRLTSLLFLSYDFFKIWPWKSKVKVMGEVTVQSHKVGLASLSIHVNRPSRSWDTAFSKFDLGNQRSRSLVRSQFKSQWGSNILSTHIPFVPELWLFQNLTLKIKGQGHGWGHNSKSQCGSSILSTHIPFDSCQSALPFLRYSIFKIWPWKSKVKVIGEVTVQSHNVGLASYRLTSLLFHVNRPSHSWDTAFSKFDLENQGLRWGHSSKSQCRSNILLARIPVIPCQSAVPFLRYSIFKIRPWKSRVKVKWPWCCTTTGLDNSIELWMV